MNLHELWTAFELNRKKILNWCELWTEPSFGFELKWTFELNWVLNLNWSELLNWTEFWIWTEMNFWTELNFKFELEWTSELNWVLDLNQNELLNWTKFSIWTKLNFEMKQIQNLYYKCRFLFLHLQHQQQQHDGALSRPCCLKKSYELCVNVVRTGGICEINIALIWTIWTILNDSTIDFPIPNLILK